MLEQSEKLDQTQLKQFGLERLKNSIQALALPAELQAKLFPDFVCKADELALTFEQWYGWANGSGEQAGPDKINLELSAAQKSGLDLLDKKLAEMSGPAQAELWTEAALEQRAEWQEIRDGAKKVLQVFDWPLEVPPAYTNEYVGG